MPWQRPGNGKVHVSPYNEHQLSYVVYPFVGYRPYSYHAVSRGIPIKTEVGRERNLCPFRCRREFETVYRSVVPRGFLHGITPLAWDQNNGGMGRPMLPPVIRRQPWWEYPNPQPEHIPRAMCAATGVAWCGVRPGRRTRYYAGPMERRRTRPPPSLDGWKSNTD